MTQIVEEEKGCSTRERTGESVLVLDWGKEWLRGFPLDTFPGHLPRSCIPLPSCELSTE